MKWMPGELDQKVVIQRETLAADGIGGSTVSVSTIATVWAKVISNSGREREFGDRLNAEAGYKFVIRWRSDVLDSDRIVYGGNSYNIRNIAKEGGRKLYLEIDAERGVAQ